MHKGYIKDIEPFKKYGTRHFYKKNTIIYQEHYHGNYFYLINKGLVKVITTTSKGGERILNIGYPGQFIGIQAFNNNKHITTAITIKDSILYWFDFNEISQLISNEPGFLDIITDSISHNTSILTKSLYIDSMKAKQRLCFLILMYINDFENDRIALTINDFTKYTGLTRVRVYQVLKEWDEKKIIKIMGRHFYVLDSEYIKGIFKDNGG
jgi:CRP-like cAMP-binding protein